MDIGSLGLSTIQRICPNYARIDVMIYLYAYLASVIAFLAVEIVWLNVVADTFYRNRLGSLLAETYSIGVGLVFYAIYLFGIMFFVVRPVAERGGNLVDTVLVGALFGFICYAVYNLTNMAVLQGWSWQVVFVDVAWGAVVTAFAAAVAYGVVRILS